MSWTDERVEQLKLHWMEGKSASQIASLLGHGLSRNAVIGKVHRLGLAGRAKSPNSGGARPRRPAPSPTAYRAAAPRLTQAAPRITRGATALAIAPEALSESDLQVFESVVVPMSLRVTIVELKESMCRWPLGTAPTMAGSPTSPPRNAGANAIACAERRCGEKGRFGPGEEQSRIILWKRLRSAEGLVEGVAGAAHGADRIPFAPPRQGFAQSSDVNVYRALIDLRRLPPHAVEQLRAREHPARLFEQVFEQPELGRTKVDVARAPPNAPRLSIQVEVSGKEALSDPLRSAAPKQRAHARHQLRH
jgi:GcrA cell cycle regulator